MYRKGYVNIHSYFYPWHWQTLGMGFICFPCLLLGRTAMTNLDNTLKSRDIKKKKKQRYYFANKGPSSQSYGFSNSHVWMWELDSKESWAPKNWCFWTVVLEKSLESLLDCREIQPVNSKGNQSWIFIGRTDAKAETPNPLATWCEELTPWKRPWCWERLKAGGEGDDWGRDGWMASLTLWTQVWVNSGSWWWTGKSGVLKSVGSQRVRHCRATELNWTEDWLLWSSCSPRDSQESFPTPQFKSINSSTLSFRYGPTLTTIHDY